MNKDVENKNIHDHSHDEHHHDHDHCGGYHHHGHDHDHDHDHEHGHDHSHAKAMPTDKWVPHTHEPGVPHEHGVNDYMKAVAEYRKTWPTKQDVIEQTPDPAVREMILRMEQIGCDTVFDRFDKQQPQCTFGIAGVCCRVCFMGPCKITPKSPRGVCGADADLIVARNMTRAVAGGLTQHGAHAREILISLKAAANDQLDIPILGEEKIRTVCKAFNIPEEGRSLKEVANDLADVLLEDLSRALPGEYKTITAMAPAERRADIATDALFGQGGRRTSKVNIGALKKGYVNIAVHGHLPTLVSQICKIGASEEYLEKAKAIGAKGIQFYGICCSGLSSMYRYENVIPLCNAIGAELVLGTGALDCWVADVQDVFPAIMDVARCFNTKVITTSDATRLPGAEHIGYDHHHTNLSETKELARKILDRALEAHELRKGMPVFIPPYEITAEVGFSPESTVKHYGSFKPLAEALKSGKVRGIVNVVGCSNPRVIYEKATVDVVDTLIKNGCLILTNGCASFPLMKLGYCNTDAIKKCSPALQEFLGDDQPPVWHVGECVDNARSSGIFGGIAAELGLNLPQLPFAMSSPEWSNEKGVGASLGFRLMGINSYHCVEPPTQGSDAVTKWLKEDTKDLLGSVMYVNTDPVKVAEKILADMDAKRAALGWAEVK
ncbi:MAG: carbon monoxide dehydrogenase [Veillonella sp.]|nr:carbon monoxide dehydrogenase [Veillonella sp.]